MDAGSEEAADVLDTAITTQPDVRRAAHVDLDDDLIEEIEYALEQQRHAIETFFGTPLAEREGPSILRYRDGGFYKRHRDRGEMASWPGAARRHCAVVVFLNSSRTAGDAGAFDGGTLDLHFDEGTVRVEPEAGMLVAFPADVLHEVKTVRDGVHDTIVDWFYEQPVGGRR